MDTTNIPKNLLQLNRDLSASLKQTLNEYTIGAFAGIRRFEPIEILRSLDAFSHILSREAFDYITAAVSDAIDQVIVESAMSKMRANSASTDPISRFATKARVNRYVHTMITKFVIKESADEEPVTRVVIIRNSDFFLYDMTNSAGVIDLTSMDEEHLDVFKKQIFRCDQVTVTDLEAMVSVEAMRVASMLTQICCAGCGVRLSTKKFTPIDTAYSCLSQYIKNADKLRTYTEAKDDETIKALSTDFSSVFATAMIHMAVINGVNQDVAEGMIGKVNYKFAWSHEKGKTPTFTVMMMAGVNAFAKGAKFTDLITTIKDSNETKKKQLSAGTTRICKLLLEASAMFTTAILADSLPENYMEPIVVESDTEQEDTSQSDET